MRLCYYTVQRYLQCFVRKPSEDIARQDHFPPTLSHPHTFPLSSPTQAAAGGDMPHSNWLCASEESSLVRCTESRAFEYATALRVVPGSDEFLD